MEEEKFTPSHTSESQPVVEVRQDIVDYVFGQIANLYRKQWKEDLDNLKNLGNLSDRALAYGADHVRARVIDSIRNLERKNVCTPTEAERAWEKWNEALQGETIKAGWPEKDLEGSAEPSGPQGVVNRSRGFGKNSY